MNLWRQIVHSPSFSDARSRVFAIFIYLVVGTTMMIMLEGAGICSIRHKVISQFR
jgi:hypothetical protein